MNVALKRITSDYRNLLKSEFCGVFAVPENDKDYSKFICVIEGPKNSPMEKGLYFLRMTIPIVGERSYPISPPSVVFLNKKYILNNHVFDTWTCVSFLNTHGNGWKSSYTILTILIALQSFLLDPNPGETVRDIQTCEKLAKESAIPTNFPNLPCIPKLMEGYNKRKTALETKLIELKLQEDKKLAEIEAKKKALEVNEKNNEAVREEKETNTESTPLSAIN